MMEMDATSKPAVCYLLELLGGTVEIPESYLYEDHGDRTITTTENIENHTITITLVNKDENSGS